jgi:hypothetical protein
MDKRMHLDAREHKMIKIEERKFDKNVAGFTKVLRQYIITQKWSVLFKKLFKTP